MNDLASGLSYLHPDFQYPHVWKERRLPRNVLRIYKNLFHIWKRKLFYQVMMKYFIKKPSTLGL